MAWYPGVPGAFHALIFKQYLAGTGCTGARNSLQEGAFANRQQWQFSQMPVG